MKAAGSSSGREVARLNVHQKLQVARLGEEGPSKAEQAENQAACSEQPSCGCKGNTLRTTGSTAPRGTGTRLPPGCCAESIGGRDSRVNQPQHALKPKPEPVQDPPFDSVKAEVRKLRKKV